MANTGVAAELRVICTHQGAAGFGRPHVFGVSRSVAVVEGATVVHRELAEFGEMGPDTLRCPRCRRNPRFTARQWQKLCDSWRADGRDTLDISLLAR